MRSKLWQTSALNFAVNPSEVSIVAFLTSYLCRSSLEVSEVNFSSEVNVLHQKYSTCFLSQMFCNQVSIRFFSVYYWKQTGTNESCKGTGRIGMYTSRANLTHMNIA